jgi:Dimerisation domain of Zinc Transporter
MNIQGISTTLDALRDLSDAPASPEQTQKLRERCLTVPGVLSVQNLQARRSGPFLYVECTVGVPGNISASAAHRIAELCRSELMDPHALCEEPAPVPMPDTDDRDVNHIQPHAAPTHRVANAVVIVDPLGSSGLGERSPDWARDHDSVARAVEMSVLSLENITAVSEVQVSSRRCPRPCRCDCRCCFGCRFV